MFAYLATSALDSTSENAVNQAIDSIIHEKHITVILAAHRLSSIARAERVIVLENGVVSEQGRYDILVGTANTTVSYTFTFDPLFEMGESVRDGVLMWWCV